MIEPRELQADDMRARTISLFRYAQVGLCVNSVTHDINNYLGAILAYSELVDMSEDLSTESRRMLREIIEGVRRCTSVLSTLTVVARREKPAITVLDPARLLAQVVELRGHDVRFQRIQLDHQSESNIPSIIADHAKLELAMMYLLSNAAEAVVDESVKIVRVGVTYADDTFFIAFWNSGPAIPEATRAIMFEPFTTSKGSGHIGLGLTMAQQIATEHGGSLTYTPEKGFVMALPRVNGFSNALE